MCFRGNHIHKDRFFSGLWIQFIILLSHFECVPNGNAGRVNR